MYYWPKDKSEAQFQFMDLISHLSINTEIFIVGNNCSGIRNVSRMFKKWIFLNKIDYARHSILFSGFLTKRTNFFLKDFYQTHIWNNLFIKSLPGVFGYKTIDAGSKLLASTFFPNSCYKEILDIGCGTGFLAVSVLNVLPNSIVSLIDDNVVALHCSQLTLNSNNFKGEVIRSNLYSNIFKKFDLIISNPPFHDDLKINFNIIEKIICNSRLYLKHSGELRFVTNRCFNYNLILKKYFKKFKILIKTNTYQVYQAFLN
ncbi:methyltransferase [Buchnera aphidicola]|nr:methyltransferase [Buchnera aphidicola]